MITINPCKNLDIYSDKIRQMFKECKVEDLPPHIYSVGQAAYKNMMTTKKDSNTKLP
jgi:myosin heavy subunit